MRFQLSIRAMLVGLFAAAIVASVTLAATGLVSNNRLVTTQTYLLDEVMPQQAQGRAIGEVLAGFSDRHATLARAESSAALGGVPETGALESEFEGAVGTIRDVAADDPEVQELLDAVEAGFGDLLAADGELMDVRREHLELLERIEARTEEMDELVRELLVGAENLAGRAMLERARLERDVRIELDLADGDVRELPPVLVAALIMREIDIAQISSDFRTSVALLADLSRRLQLLDNAAAMQRVRDGEIDRHFRAARNLLDTINQSDVDEAVRARAEGAGELAEQIEDLSELMVEGEESVYALRVRQTELDARQQEVLTDVERATDGVRAALADMEQHVMAETEAAAGTAEALANAGRNTIIVVTLVVIGLLAVFGFRTLQRVLVPIGQMRRQMEAMGSDAEQNADLSMRIHTGRDDELGRTAAAFNRMMETFQEMIQNIVRAAGDLQQQSNQLERLSETTSTTAARQQSETEEVATAVNEMATTVQEVARNTQHAADLASNGHDAANRGKTVVDETTASIDRLSRAVERAVTVIGDLKGQTDGITKVLSVIQEVSEQTNLLALNAAIEAARAGEHGRGFAVVADEVRTLASRTQESAKEIEEMIGKLQTGADEGVSVMQESRGQAETSVTQAGEAGAALETITSAVSEITDMNAQVASATEEQSAVADKINESIVRISEIARDNASANQQVTDAGQELIRLSNELQQMAGRFRT